MSFYSDMATKTDELLQSFGQSVTMNRVSAPVYDPDSGVVTSSSVEYVGTGAVFKFKQKYDGVELGDRELYLSPYQTNGSMFPMPTTDDQFVIGSTTYAIKNVVETSPAGTAVLYQLHLRGL